MKYCALQKYVIGNSVISMNTTDPAMSFCGGLPGVVCAA